jgi:hypothetical protein
MAGSRRRLLWTPKNVELPRDRRRPLGMTATLVSNVLGVGQPGARARATTR